MGTISIATYIASCSFFMICFGWNFSKKFHQTNFQLIIRNWRTIRTNNWQRIRKLLSCNWNRPGSISLEWLEKLKQAISLNEWVTIYNHNNALSYAVHWWSDINFWSNPDWWQHRARHIWRSYFAFLLLNSFKKFKGLPYQICSCTRKELAPWRKIVAIEQTFNTAGDWILEFGKSELLFHFISIYSFALWMNSFEQLRLDWTSGGQPFAQQRRRQAAKLQELYSLLWFGNGHEDWR